MLSYIYQSASGQVIMKLMLKLELVILTMQITCMRMLPSPPLSSSPLTQSTMSIPLLLEFLLPLMMHMMSLAEKLILPFLLLKHNYGITRKAKEAASHDGADIPAESVPTSANQAYGTAICQNTDDTYDYI